MVARFFWLCLLQLRTIARAASNDTQLMILCSRAPTAASAVLEAEPDAEAATEDEGESESEEEAAGGASQVRPGKACWQAVMGWILP